MAIRELTRDESLQVSGGQSVSLPVGRGTITIGGTGGIPPDGGRVTVNVPFGSGSGGHGGGSGGSGTDWAARARELKELNDRNSGQKESKLSPSN